MQETLKKHFEDDVINFKRIDIILSNQQEDHRKFDEKLNEIKKFMENLSGISDMVKGATLMKKPALWLLAFVVGGVALFGGIKTFLAVLLTWITPKI